GRRVHGVDPWDGGDAVGDGLRLLLSVVGEVESLGPAGQQLAGRRRVTVADEEDEGGLGATTRGHGFWRRNLPFTSGFPWPGDSRDRRLLQVSAPGGLARA